VNQIAEDGGKLMNLMSHKRMDQLAGEAHLVEIVPDGSWD
jgi:hypothetical protein